MAAATTPLKTLTAVVAVFLLVEAAGAAGAVGFIGNPILRLGLLRLAQTACILALVVRSSTNGKRLGLDPGRFAGGLAGGLRWACGLALVVGILGTLFFLIGRDPLSLLRVRVPAGQFDRVIFFLVGGTIAPVAEELVFRGAIYGYLRRFGVPAAVPVSALLFAAAHGGGALLPLVPFIGGLIFACAYERSDSLLAPIVIHCSGNLALFSISILPF